MTLGGGATGKSSFPEAFPKGVVSESRAGRKGQEEANPEDKEIRH